MIRFLFLEAMLIGAKFNNEKNLYINKPNKSIWGVILLFISYFILKLCFYQLKINNFSIAVVLSLALMLLLTC